MVHYFQALEALTLQLNGWDGKMCFIVSMNNTKLTNSNKIFLNH